MEIVAAGDNVALCIGEEVNDAVLNAGDDYGH